jgi:hypothetical protein
MMKAVSSQLSRIDVNGNEWMMCVIVSETEPASLEITGADVDGLADTNRIAAGSVILTPGKTYIAFSDGKFTERA